MTEFKAIADAAAALVGGGDALQARLVRPEAPGSLAMVGDDRYLSVMSRRIFRAGLTHSQVDARWPAFEAAFNQFDLELVSSLDDPDIARLARDTTLIRHRGKLTAVRDNAIAMQGLVHEHGSFGSWLAQWPEEAIVDLWWALRSRFSQLGGHSAPSFLRMAGKDTFLLTDWVAAALAHWGAFEGKVASRGSHRAIQAVFNTWQTQSGLPLCQISQILALSLRSLAR